MIDDAAFAFDVAQRAIALMLGTTAGIFLVVALFSKKGRVIDAPKRVVGATLVIAIPAGFAMLVGLAASTILQAASAPGPTYLFTALAALASFRPAFKAKGEMAGCSQLLGVGLAGYALSWSIVSFWATGGWEAARQGALPAAIALPPLAALPFVGFIMKVADKQRTIWLFLGSTAFFCLVQALMFLPIENGFAAGMLPASDWLRFPLAGAAWAALFAAVRLAAFARLKPNIRRSRRSNLRFALLFVGGMMVASGFSWAAARAIVGAIAGPV